MPKTPRIAALQKLLRKQKVPALLVTAPENVFYLTGLHASEALLLVRRDRATLFVDGRYAEVAGTLRSPGLRVAERSKIATEFSKLRRCGYEEDHVSAARLRRWSSKFKNTKFIHTSGLVEGLRRKKYPDEITLMKRALSITDDVLSLVPAMLTPGVTEKQVATKILLAMLDRGADGFAFDAIVAFGPNSSLPHHRAGSRTLRKRDIVQIDIGATYKHYCSDRSEVYFVGEPTAVQRRAYDAVLAAKNAAKEILAAGVSCKALDLAATRELKKRGFKSYPHALGHGLGIDVHEGPTISSRTEELLASGDVVTLEPGVYIPGKFGIRLEDTLFVK